MHPATIAAHRAAMVAGCTEWEHVTGRDHARLLPQNLFSSLASSRGSKDQLRSELDFVVDLFQGKRLIDTGQLQYGGDARHFAKQPQSFCRACVLFDSYFVLPKD